MAMNTGNSNAFKPYLRGLPAIAGFVLLCVFVAGWYLRHATPMYESTVKIRLADPHNGESSANLYKDFDIFATSNQIGTEVEMVKAKALIEKTLDSIEMSTIVYRQGKILKKELYHDNPLLVHVLIKNRKWYKKPIKITVLPGDHFLLTPPDSLSAYDGRFSQLLSLKDAEIWIGRNDSLLQRRPSIPLAGKYVITVLNEDETVSGILDRLDITSVDKDVPILRIIYKSAVPEKAADYVNILANTYISDYVETKSRAANITLDFVNRQLVDVTRRLAHSQDTIEQFRRDNHIVNIQQETETDLRKIAQLKIQLANLQMSLAAIDSLNQYIQQGKNNFMDLAPNFEAFTDLLSTEMIKKLKQLQSDKRDLLLRFTENDDKVRVVDDKIGDISSYLLESIKNTRKNYQIKYDEIDQAITDAGKVFTGLPEREKNMAILERDYGLNEKIFTYLQQKKTEAGIARAATISFHRIVARGRVPEDPVSPNKVVILAVSAILGLLASAGAIYMVHKAKAKVNDSRTIEKNSGTPIALEVRMLKKEVPARKQFNDLAISLDIKKIVTCPSVLTVSSFSRKEGKSYVAAGIARGMAALQKNVLLVDTAGTIPARQKWRPGPPGADGVQTTPVPLLQYYKAGEETPDKVVIRENLARKLDTWKQQFDLIIIRNGNMLDSGNTLVFTALAETNLFVLDSRRTPAKMVEAADLMKEEYHIPGMYFVLNRAGYAPGVLTEWKEAILRLWRRVQKKHPE